MQQQQPHGEDLVRQSHERPGVSDGGEGRRRCRLDSGGGGGRGGGRRGCSGSIINEKEQRPYVVVTGDESENSWVTNFTSC